MQLVADVKQLEQGAVHGRQSFVVVSPYVVAGQFAAVTQFVPVKNNVKQEVQAVNDEQLLQGDWHGRQKPVISL